MTELIRNLDHDDQPQVRAYIDLDGVIYPIYRLDNDTPDDPDIDKRHNFEWWRKSVVTRLGRLATENVLASSWGRSFVNSSSAFKSPKAALSPARALDTSAMSKQEAVLQDLNNDPKPFVWIEDDLNKSMIDYIKNGLNHPVPGLFVKPYDKQGLTNQELDAIEAGFLNQIPRLY